MGLPYRIKLNSLSLPKSETMALLSLLIVLGLYLAIKSQEISYCFSLGFGLHFVTSFSQLYTSLHTDVDLKPSFIQILNEEYFQLQGHCENPQLYKFLMNSSSVTKCALVFIGSCPIYILIPMQKDQ